MTSIPQSSFEVKQEWPVEMGCKQVTRLAYPKALLDGLLEDLDIAIGKELERLRASEELRRAIHNYGNIIELTFTYEHADETEPILAQGDLSPIEYYNQEMRSMVEHALWSIHDLKRLADE